MKTKRKLARLMFNKETIANLNNNEMKFIVGRGFDEGPGVILTDSCNPCAIEEPGQIYTQTCPWQTCGESCH